MFLWNAASEESLECSADAATAWAFLEPPKVLETGKNTINRMTFFPSYRVTALHKPIRHLFVVAGGVAALPRSALAPPPPPGQMYERGVGEDPPGPRRCCRRQRRRQRRRRRRPPAWRRPRQLWRRLGARRRRRRKDQPSGDFRHSAVGAPRFLKDRNRFVEFLYFYTQHDPLKGMGNAFLHPSFHDKPAQKVL